jgi:hypothetical protein
MRSHIRAFGAAIAVTVLVAGSAPRAAAQQTGSVILTPYVALYAPTAGLFGAREVAGPYATSLSGRHDPAFATGVNGSYWFTHRLGMEVGGAYAWSDVKALGSLSNGATTLPLSARRDAHVILGSAKAMVNLLPTWSMYNLRFGVGPAVISRGGSIYQRNELGEFTHLTDVGVATSLCSRIPLARDLFLRVRAESYMYTAKLQYRDPTDPTATYDFTSRSQHDVLLSAGVQYTFR